MQGCSVDDDVGEHCSTGQTWLLRGRQTLRNTTTLGPRRSVTLHCVHPPSLSVEYDIQKGGK